MTTAAGRWTVAAICRDPNLIDGIVMSLEIAVLTVLGMLLLLVPTMIWTIVRVPRMRRVVEFLCLLPLAIPAIVIVVGIAPIYRWMGRTGRSGVAADARPHRHHPRAAVRLPRHRCGPPSVDVATLADASRSLGAGWPRAIVQVIVPNIRGGILSAAVIAIALVLGEFTISSLFTFDTLQVVIYLLGKRDPFIVGRGLAGALVFAFVLLIVIARFARVPGRAPGSPRRRPRHTRPRGSVRPPGRSRVMTPRPPAPAARPASACSSRTCTVTTATSTPSTD